MVAGLYGKIFLNAATPVRIEHVYTSQFTKSVDVFEVTVEIYPVEQCEKELVL